MPASADESARLLAAIRRTEKARAMASEKRRLAVKAAFDAGVPRADIADALGVSVGRIYQIIDGR